ncbi:extracellular GDSL-like lipase/acylhydrolase [Lentinus tigrinus ALCF2SS1-7]|uniref:Extracellular GDSL-like lipase/acylhydrolase n=1 Tax=Lentinus tigrinus ALCF2SS1-6 TaxID=1328759 RepID=A0A5C2SN45_9APHY|nr:extracellular GDSL-like lipase/acylhydrolase [Lentinus tigrinus ALCF2SS1-6]RPD79326.1 extracellular GDSL-like lipase/acylhydrolase [Lentinus tigrinus ALCF2SS1-7]
MPQLTEPANLPNPPFNTTGLVFHNSTLRQTIHVTAPSSHIRLRISNAFGTTSLPITNVTIARPLNGTAGSPAIDTSTLKTLTFSGSPSFTIPNGALVVSDPIDFDVKAQTELTISMFLADGQVGNDITSHPGSRTTTWMTFGNQVSAANITGSSVQSVAHWYFISTLDAWVPTSIRTVAIVGDSITDGRGSDDNRNNRWPDLLLARLQSSGDSTLNTLALGNQAAGGNRILADGLGPNAIGRFDRDVLSQPGVRYAMIFEGVNDIGVAGTSAASQQAIGDAVIAAYKQMILRAHAAGLPMFGATITPFSAPGFNASIQGYSSPVREATRQRVNDFIRNGGWFDAVADFDAVVRDPSAPSQLKAEFNSGDFLHPNVAGYTAIANAFPVEIFKGFADGVDGWA